MSPGGSGQQEEDIVEVAIMITPLECAFDEASWAHINRDRNLVSMAAILQADSLARAIVQISGQSGLCFKNAVVSSTSVPIGHYMLPRGLVAGTNRGVAFQSTVPVWQVLIAFSGFPDQADPYNLATALRQNPAGCLSSASTAMSALYELNIAVVCWEDPSVQVVVSLALEPFTPPPSMHLAAACPRAVAQALAGRAAPSESHTAPMAARVVDLNLALHLSGQFMNCLMTAAP